MYNIMLILKLLIKKLTFKIEFELIDYSFFNFFHLKKNSKLLFSHSIAFNNLSSSSFVFILNALIRLLIIFLYLKTLLKI